jgi:hypothetical protein
VNKTNRTTILLLIALLGIAGLCMDVRAEDAKSQSETTWLAAADTKVSIEPVGAKTASEPALKEWEKPVPIGLYLDYTLTTDYIWRGINLSEYRGEGREKLNHQLTAGINYDTGDFGTFDFGVWFEWYGANDNVQGAGAGNLQEVDYTFTWTYDLSKCMPSVPVELSIGWVGYDLPQLRGDGRFTNEYFIGLALDDQALFGENWFALNPTVTYYQDLDDVASVGQASWLEFGISHEFALADCPHMGTIPIIKDLTLTPSFAVTVDIGYIDSGTRIATNQYGLAVGYDLGQALNLPEQYGSISLTGFLNYSDAIADDSPNINLNDEFWGGFSVGWEW